ncbi:MAG TPA: hypothetical protein VFG68_12055 [Fimbriiglobus sp.]|nr:hypothetical protein [Fimbriiglobus sp.]
MKQWPQGLWVVTPEGKVLAFHYHRNTPGLSYRDNAKKWVDDTIEMLEKAIQAAGPLPPRAVRAANPFPDRGVGLTRDGGARLAVSVIGQLRGKQEGAPAVDSVLLTKAEWAAFAPPDGKAEWVIPKAEGMKFAPALSHLTDSILAPRPADVTTAAITAKVVRQADGLVVVRYTGTWQSRHLRDGNERFPITAEAAGRGIGVYDPAAKAMRSLVWVLNGKYRNGAKATPVPTAAVVEWVAEAPDE